MDEHKTSIESLSDAERRFYGAVASVMSELEPHAPEEARPLLGETAIYWLQIGLVLGLRHAGDPSQAAVQLLELAMAGPCATDHDDDLAIEAEDFLEAALG